MEAKDYNEQNAIYFEQLKNLEKGTRAYKELHDEIYEFNQGLIIASMAKLKYNNNEDFLDDTIVAGIKLSNCIDRFDPSKGVTFATYAMHCIYKYVLAYVNSRNKKAKSEQKGRNTHKVYSYDALTEYKRNPELDKWNENPITHFGEASYLDSYDNLDRESIISFLTPYLDDMTKRQKEIIFAKYFSSDNRVLSDRCLAELFGVSYQSIAIVKNAAYKRMRTNIGQLEAKEDISSILEKQ